MITDLKKSKRLKRLVIASAVVSTLAAFSAQADVRMIVGGYVDAQVGFRSEDDRFERLNIFAIDSMSASESDLDKRRGEAIVHDSTLSFLVTGHTDAILNGLGFGGKIVLEADTSSSKYHLPYIDIDTRNIIIPNSNPSITVPDGDWFAINYPSGSSARDFAYNQNRNAREVMLFFEGLFGRVEVGNTYGATKKMQVDAGTVAAGNGGIHGDSTLWINPAPLFGSLSTADLYTNKKRFYHLDHTFTLATMRDGSTIALPFSTELATAGKVSYYSPSFNGLQFGVSYIRDTDITGTVANTTVVTENASVHGFGFENVFEGGFTYDGDFAGFNFKLSVLGQTGSAKARSGDLYQTSALLGDITYEDLGGFEIGFATEFMGIGFAASYGNQDGLLSTLDDNEYFTVGLGYEYGPWAFSVNYMDSTQKTNSSVDESGGVLTRKAEFNNLVFDIAYSCQGLMPYLSVAVFEAIRPEYYLQPRYKNDGTVVLLGTKLSF